MTALFCKAYTGFIGTIRKVYPHAQFITLTSPMADETLKKGMIKTLLLLLNMKINTAIPMFISTLSPKDTIVDVADILPLGNIRESLAN